MARGPGGAITEVSRVAAITPQPRGSIDTRNQSRREQAQRFSEGNAPGPDETPSDGAPKPTESAFKFILSIASADGDICDLLPMGEADRIGNDAVREWNLDRGSMDYWEATVRRGLDLAAQDQDGDNEKDWPWEGASNIHYPILTVGSQQWAARAYPELVKGDKAVGVKTFSPPDSKPSPGQIVKAGGQPANPQDAQASAMSLQQDQQHEAKEDLIADARKARGERVKHYMNWLIFYKMDNWEGETDQLLHEMPISGIGFKKVYMGDHGLCSDYVSPLRLTVNSDTRSLLRCPRITQDFDIYPYEIEQGRRSERYRDIDLDQAGSDPEAPRLWIEQHRLEDLDGDGIAEPYIVTVDVMTMRTMRIEAAFTPDDVIVDATRGQVLRVERWQPFPTFRFLPDPKGRFYGLGFAKLLDSITDSVDTAINQMIDAGSAEIAGGGFIGSGVRLQGSGQGGSIWFRPGEYQTVSTPGPNLQQSIWERTTPHPSAVTFQMVELLLAAAKDIASVKDVITGDTPATAPVGTTLALQNQALQVFSATYKRVYRGFREEFQLMYQCLRKWGTDRERKEYKELTGGDFDQDFSGDGTDIQPISDPSVVTKMQKISRFQSLVQLAESAVGMAAGMTQPGPAQEIVQEGLDLMEWDRPERFVATVPPNPEAIAKTQDMAAAAKLKTAQAGAMGAKTVLDHAKTLREVALASNDTHHLHQEASRIAEGGSVAPPPEGGMNDQGAAPPAPGPASPGA